MEAFEAGLLGSGPAPQKEGLVEFGLWKELALKVSVRSCPPAPSFVKRCRERPAPGQWRRESRPRDARPFCAGRAGAVGSAASEKVRTRLEELDDFEEVSASPAEPREPARPGPVLQRRLFSLMPEQARVAWGWAPWTCQLKPCPRDAWDQGPSLLPAAEAVAGRAGPSGLLLGLRELAKGTTHSPTLKNW